MHLSQYAIFGFLPLASAILPGQLRLENPVEVEVVSRPCQELYAYWDGTWLRNIGSVSDEAAGCLLITTPNIRREELPLIAQAFSLLADHERPYAGNLSDVYGVDGWPLHVEGSEEYEAKNEAYTRKLWAVTFVMSGTLLIPFVIVLNILIPGLWTFLFDRAFAGPIGFFWFAYGMSTKLLAYHYNQIFEVGTWESMLSNIVLLPFTVYAHYLAVFVVFESFRSPLLVTVGICDLIVWFCYGHPGSVESTVVILDAVNTVLAYGTAMLVTRLMFGRE